MGYETKIQVIKRANDTRQFYVICPAPLAQALEMEQGETIEWVVELKIDGVAAALRAALRFASQGGAMGFAAVEGGLRKAPEPASREWVATFNSYTTEMVKGVIAGFQAAISANNIEFDIVAGIAVGGVAVRGVDRKFEVGDARRVEPVRADAA